MLNARHLFRCAIAALLCAGPAMAQVAEVPDGALTPGAVASTDVGEVCGHSGGLTYSKAHRQTSPELKRQIRWAYHARPGDGEADHLLPLCLGGADVAANLWWQPGDGQGARFTYHDKDKLEAEACRMVCAGKADLHAAQAWFLAPADWRTAYCAVVAPSDPRCQQ